MQRTLILAVVFALISSNVVRAANPVDCTQSGATNNGDKCTTAGGSPASTPLSCKTGFVLTKTADNVVSCQAAGTTPCAVRAPISTISGATTNNVNTCVTSITVPAADTDATANWIAATAANQACASTTANSVTTKYTVGTTQTTATNNGPFTATPLNSWQCYACPVGCDNCDPTNAGKFTPADATKTQTQCKTAAAGYFLSKDTDSNSGNAGGVCPSAITAAGAAGTYGGNASTTAAVITCTECYGTGATNCTKISGTCPKNAAGKDTTYISFADITTVGTYKVGDVTYNLSGLNTTQLGGKSLQGCYDVAALNSSYYNQATSSSTKSANIIASVSAVVIAVVASVFVF